MKSYNALIYKYSRHSRHFRHSKFLFLIILIIPWGPILHAQKILTLKECYDRAMTATSLAGEKTAYSDISILKDNNLSKEWLPTIDANGSFVYNSSVVDMRSVRESFRYRV